jgi:CheY-like chemotaxis protein
MYTPMIAIVENDPSFRGSLTQRFMAEGYRVVTWSRDVGAYAMVRREMPDIVLLDLWLDRPEAGEVVLALLRADPRTRDIPVVVCAAHNRFLGAPAPEPRQLGCRTGGASPRMSDC